MTLAAVHGQARAVDALKSAMRSGSLHHAWLFAGPEGVGKELAAIGFAQALCCPTRPGEGCGECGTCGRIARRNHPDVQWVMTEAEQISRGIAGRSDFTGTPSREIKIDQIRKLQERLALHPLECDRKIAIITSAHTMNDSAANAFLKTLEEPPKRTMIVLIASSPDDLLPTIRSRCLRVHFGPLSEDFVAERVQQERKVDADTARLAAVMSNGSLARALEMDVQGLKRRRELIEAFEAISFDDARTMLGFAESFGGSREDAEETLRILDLWTRDVAVVRAGASSVANRDLIELAAKAAARVTDAELHRRHRLIAQAQEFIAENNASGRLQLERTLIEMAWGSSPAGGAR